MLKVACVKHGTKFPAYYVNRLKNMVQRNLASEHEFVCFTEDRSGVDAGITCLKLPDLPLVGWWWKPYVFKPGHFDDGCDILFFDLDMVIVKDITALVDFMPGHFVGLRDVGRVFRGTRKKLGSAVMRWPANRFADIWTSIEKDSSLTERFRGDQDWIWQLYQGEIKFYPDEWIKSYKWEIRNKRELTGRGDEMRFDTVVDPVIRSDTCVLAFHGNPRLDVVNDPIILNNWC